MYKAKSNKEKKQKIYLERNEVTRQNYQTELAKLTNHNGSNLIYVDEAGIEKCPFREYARGEKGKRVVGEVSGLRHSRTSMVSGYWSTGKNLIKPKTYKGHTTTEVFYNWLREDLLPYLKDQSKQTKVLNYVIIVDNASFHRSIRIKELVASYGFTLLFLSAYSPDLNPIEHQWEKLKKRLAKMRTKTENFLDDLKYTLWQMSNVQV